MNVVTDYEVLTDSVDHLIGFGAILNVDANDVRWEVRQTVKSIFVSSVGATPSEFHVLLFLSQKTHEDENTSREIFASCLSLLLLILIEYLSDALNSL